MSAKKMLLSDKEYRKIFLRLIQARKELNVKFIKAMEANARIPEYGEIFLRYLNRFKSYAEKNVAILDIFFLGLNVRRAADEIDATEKAEDEKFGKILEEMKKTGKMPSS